MWLCDVSILLPDLQQTEDERQQVPRTWRLSRPEKRKVLGRANAENQESRVKSRDLEEEGGKVGVSIEARVLRNAGRERGYARVSAMRCESCDSEQG